MRWNDTQTQANTLYDLLFSFRGFVWLTNHLILPRTHSRRVLSKIMRACARFIGTLKGSVDVRVNVNCTLHLLIFTIQQLVLRAKC